MVQVGNPIYGIKFYREGRYKIVKYLSSRSLGLPKDPFSDSGSDDREDDGKYAQAYSRAKSVIFQIAICNDWDYFCTFTIDRTKYDRYNFKPFYKAFTQWLRDYRKKYQCRIEYCLIPEQHEDGAWHLHGFMRGIPQSHLTSFVPGVHPKKLVEGGFLNWGAASSKFGFCSLDRIRDPERTASYATKYITKDLLRSNNSYGAHIYMCSLGLRRALSLGYVCTANCYLDRFISHVGQFCGTGWALNVSWSSLIPLIDIWQIPELPLPEIDYGPEELDQTQYVVDFFEQLNIAGWSNG